MTCSQATDTIVLHSYKLKIDTKAVVITNSIGMVMPVSGVSFAPEKQFMYVKSLQNLKPGDEYVLTIPFMGNISNDLKGYYKSSYINKETSQTRFVIRETYYIYIYIYIYYSVCIERRSWIHVQHVHVHIFLFL